MLNTITILFCCDLSISQYIDIITFEHVFYYDIYDILHSHNIIRLTYHNIIML